MKNRKCSLLTGLIIFAFCLTASGQSMLDFLNKDKGNKKTTANAKQQIQRQGQQQGNSSGVNNFTIHTYRDEKSGVWAFKMLLPERWHFNGGIKWLQQPNKVAETHFSVSSPDGSAVMEVMPDFQFWWSNNQYTNQVLQQQGLNVSQPMSAVDTIENMLIPEIRGNMQNLKIVSRKKMNLASQALTQAVQQMARTDQCVAQLMAGALASYNVGQVDITYTYNGTQIFETFITRVIYVSNSSQPIQMWGPEQTVSFATTVDKKQENLEKFVIMYSSYKDNPVYTAKLCQINVMMVQQAKQQIASIGELSRYISQTYNEISETSRMSYEFKNAASDKVFDQWSDYMRDVETYTGAGLEIKVPNTSQSVWHKGDQVVFSADPNFDANRHLGGSWARLNKRN